MRFAFDGVLEDLRDTQTNNVRDDNDPHFDAISNRLNTLAAQTRSVVVVFRAETGGGFSSITYDWVGMSYFVVNAFSLLAHELGHQFGLVHTFGRRFETVIDASDYVLSGGSIQNLDGDLTLPIADPPRAIVNLPLTDDTPPDPWILELEDSVAVNTVMLGGQAFSLARANLMSYWVRAEPAKLSAAQIDRVRRMVLERQRRYLNVTVITGEPSPPPPQKKVVVPDVLEGNRAGAVLAITNAGLVPHLNGPQSNNAWVFSQTPRGRVLVNAGSIVTLAMHTGPRP